MHATIVTLPGDGIGPEVIAEGVRVLRAVAARWGHSFSFEEALMGGCAIDATGTPVPDETLAACERADAVLLGAVGGPRWDNLPGDLRPEKGLLSIRGALGLYANLRPATVYPALRSASPLRDEILGDGIDIMVVRELTGGIYFGRRGRCEKDGEMVAFDTEEYSAHEIRRILKVAFELARGRGGRLCSVDKANVLESSRLWREIANEMAREYPDVRLTHMYVDNCAMQLVRKPNQFDTIVTGNMFGDILSDEASQITGSIGMLPSASLGEGSLGLYEPIHGSAPDIAGKDLANPIGSILSAALMLRHSLGHPDAANAVESAVRRALDGGLRTADIASAGGEVVGTARMAKSILSALQ